MQFQAVYYEPDALSYPLGKQLKQQYSALTWHPIESHNAISQMRRQPNAAFAGMKRNLIIGVRKTHRYTENRKISDYLVPYTSSGCTAICLYCYLVCHYNKCAYLRLFVNREQMLQKLCRFSQKTAKPAVYEIGSNSDLLLENTVTHNLEWTIPLFAKNGRGQITFPTKFDMVEPLLPLHHQGKTIFRMSINPERIIRTIELGTSPLFKRLAALQKMYDAGYPCGILIAPVILLPDWETQYEQLITQLADILPTKLKSKLTVEVIFMTYSYIHRMINRDAFPDAPELYDPALMSGRGPGKYYYRGEQRRRAELFLSQQLAQKMPESKLLYMC